MDYSIEDAAAAAKLIREKTGLSVGRLSALLDVNTKYITKCESGCMASFMYLYKVLEFYKSFDSQIIIRHGRKNP